MNDTVVQPLKVAEQEVVTKEKSCGNCVSKNVCKVRIKMHSVISRFTHVLSADYPGMDIYTAELCNEYNQE